MQRIAIGNAINWKHPLNRGLLVRYRCLPNQQRGVMWRDLCRRGTALTITGGPNWGGGRGRRGGHGCLAFDGVDESITGGVPPSTFVTVAFWYLAPSSFSGNPVPLVQGNDVFNSGSWDFGFYHLGSNLVTHFQAGSNFNLSLSGLAGTWVHIVLVRKGVDSYARAYTNGVQNVTEGHGTHTLTNTYALRTLTVASNFAVGPLDDICGWNRALSASEVASLYRAQSAQQDPTLNWRGVPDSWAQQAAVAAAAALRRGRWWWLRTD